MPQPTLILVHEPEKACFERLIADGYPVARATEISSYLAQSTDLAPDLGALAASCERRGLAFVPVELDDAAGMLAAAGPASTLVWTLTDGVAYFRGGASPALARLNGLKTIGADDSLFALCQDKFRSGAVLGALGLPVPPAGLARNGAWLVEPPASPAGWFVKPNRLGAKIGIWPDSRVSHPGHALELSRRVFSHYGDDVVVQPYVAGRNVRASFLGLAPETGVEALGIAFVDSGADFQTMADSMALYGDTGEAAKAAGASQPEAERKVRAIAQKLISGLGLKDVFSVDLRIEADDTVHLIEFEVCPGLPCFDFRDYCRRQWGMSLADAMAQTAANRLRS
jgi:D-alanine-D-alanine ligase